MTMPLASTAHLDLLGSGFVWLKCLPNAHLIEGLSCRHIACLCWPDELGREPDWFADECEILAACWDEEKRLEAEEGRAELARLESEYYADCVTK